MEQGIIYGAPYSLYSCNCASETSLLSVTPQLNDNSKHSLDVVQGRIYIAPSEDRIRYLVVTDIASEAW